MLHKLSMASVRILNISDFTSNIHKNKQVQHHNITSLVILFYPGISSLDKQMKNVNLKYSRLCLFASPSLQINHTDKLSTVAYD